MITYLNRMTTLNELKIYGSNAVAFLSTLTSLDLVIKVALGLATFCYTVLKAYSIYKNEIKKPKNKKINE